jgi:DnaK suppressor protein
MNMLSERERVRSHAGKRRDQLDEYLPRLRKALEHERDFRVEQLAELAAGAGRAATPCAQYGQAGAQAAVREIRLLIADGARQALVDIERALAAMRAGQYGYCESCTGKVPLAVLQAVPQTRLCLTCHRAPDHVDETSVC